MRLASLAPQDEVERFMRLKDDTDYLASTNEDLPRVTKETVAVAVSGMNICLSEACEFGRFIDKVLDFKTALFQGLSEAGVSKKGKGGYQLLDIGVTLSGRFGLTDMERDKRVPRFGVDISDAVVNIRRNQPPSRTQRQLNTLDTSSQTWRYGNPTFGYLTATVDTVDVFIYPLTSIPLAGLSSVKLTGFLYIVGLNSDTPGLPNVRRKVRSQRAGPKRNTEQPIS